MHSACCLVQSILQRSVIFFDLGAPDCRSPEASRGCAPHVPPPLYRDIIAQYRTAHSMYVV
eukprot:595685-Rhodomonas_salina.1